MSNKLDIHSQFSAVRALSPVALSNNTAMVSQTIDLEGCDGVEFVIAASTLADTDATFDVALYADDASGMGTEAEVTSADELYGTVTDWTFADDNTVRQFGYRGAKRYVRVKITPSNNSGTGEFCVIAIKHLKKVGSTL